MSRHTHRQKPATSEPDLTGLSDAEALAALKTYLQTFKQESAAREAALQQQIAAVQKEKTDGQISFAQKALRWRDKLSAAQDTIQAQAETIDKLSCDNRKLRVHKENMETIAAEIRKYARELTRLEPLVQAIEKDFNALQTDADLLLFIEHLLGRIVKLVLRMSHHQVRSLNLGTSEKNGGTRPALGEEDIKSIADGQADLAEAEGQQEELEADADEAEIKEVAEHGFTVDEPPQRPLAAEGEARGDTEGEAAAGKAEGKAEDAEGASAATAAGRRKHRDERASQAEAEAALRAMLADKRITTAAQCAALVKNELSTLAISREQDEYRDGGVTKRRPHRYANVIDSSMIAGILGLPDAQIERYCDTCHMPMMFKVLGKRERYNTVLVHGEHQGGINTVIAPVYKCCCVRCGETHYISPAELNDLEYTEDCGPRRHRLTGGQEEESTPDNLVADTLASLNGQLSPGAAGANAGSTADEPGADTADCPAATAANRGSAEDPVIKQPGADTTQAAEPGADTSDRPAATAANEGAAEDQAIKQPGADATQAMEPPDADGDLRQDDPLVSRRGQYHARDKERQRDRRAIYREIEQSSEKCTRSTGTNVVFRQGPHEIIDPWALNTGAYGTLPAFSKSQLSLGMLASCACLFAQIGSPKNRSYNFFQGQGLPLSREQLTGAINSFARAFLRPVTRCIKRDILTHAHSILMDESTVLVRQLAAAKRSAGKLSRKSQIFSLCSSWTCAIQASWFGVYDGRGAENIVDILKDAGPEKGPEFLTVDGYTGYDSACRILKEDYGVELNLTRCLTHLRRPLHRYLLNTRLLKVYNEDLLPRGSSFANFSENLEKYRQNPGRYGEITQKECELLTIYYLINALFYVDSAVVIRHRFNTQSEEFRQDLDKARKRSSALIIEALFAAIKLFVLDHPEVIKVSYNQRHKLHYQPGRLHPEGAALVFILKHEAQVREILKSPDIELSQSACERALKSAIVIRKNCQYLHSNDGAQAYADYNTIAATCAANDVPTLPYIYWLVANMKKRLIERCNAGHDDPSMFQMPHKQKELVTVIGPDGKPHQTGKLIGMYDPKNSLCYDRINVAGLMPYDYRRYLEARRPVASA